MEYYLLYLKSTESNNKSYLQNAFTTTSRLVFGQITGHHRAGKLTHKIKQHGWEVGVTELVTSRL